MKPQVNKQVKGKTKTTLAPKQRQDNSAAQRAAGA
jgi:hypothetical protein